MVGTLGSLLVGAFPQVTPKKSCSLSKYQFPAPLELKAVWRMKEQFVSIKGNEPWAGGHRLAGSEAEGQLNLGALSSKMDIFWGVLGQDVCFLGCLGTSWMSSRQSPAQ